MAVTCGLFASHGLSRACMLPMPQGAQFYSAGSSSLVPPTPTHPHPPRPRLPPGQPLPPHISISECPDPVPVAAMALLLGCCAPNTTGGPPGPGMSKGFTAAAPCGAPNENAGARGALKDQEVWPDEDAPPAVTARGSKQVQAEDWTKVGEVVRQGKPLSAQGLRGGGRSR